MSATNVAHRYVTSVGVGRAPSLPPPPPPPPPGPVPRLVSPLPHFSMSLYLNWPQLPADRPCVRDRQRDDASWFNYVYNIALFLINSSHSLQSPWDLSMGGESLIFEAAIGYCCLLIVVGQESAPSPISL